VYVTCPIRDDIEKRDRVGAGLCEVNGKGRRVVISNPEGRRDV
jgi:hypothetical protein